MTQLAATNRRWILAAIILLSAVLRFHDLPTIPPAAGFDAAQYGLDALEILGGARPVFLAANFGREPLFSYLVAVAYLIVGAGGFGIHLTSAFAGIATVPAIYAAGRELLRGESPAVRLWAPILAALVGAISYWHLNWSRLGLRAILLPLAAALLVAVLWRAIRTGRTSLFAGSGILLGLSLYTYQPARLLPLLVLAAFALHALPYRARMRHLARGLLITILFALLVFAPLGRFALQNPDIFNDRLRQATLLSQDGTLWERASPIVEQATAAVQMFALRGDDEPQSTIPGRPSLNPFLALAWLAGIGIALWRWKRPPYSFLLIWLLLLTAPAMLAGQAATAKRALGAFPAVAILIALGLIIPLAALNRRASGSGRPAIAAGAPALLGGVLALGLLYSALSTYRDYFVFWAREPSLAAHFQRDHEEVGRFIAMLPDDEVVFVSPFEVGHPALRLAAGPQRDTRAYDGHYCMIYSPETPGGTTYVIVPGAAELSAAQLNDAYGEGTWVQGPLRPDTGEPYFDAFQLPPSALPQLSPQVRLDAQWRGGIRLLGYSLDPPADEFNGGEQLGVTLYYEAAEDQNEDYTAFVHLVGGGENDPLLLAQSDGRPCRGKRPTTGWRQGDIVVDHIVLDVTAVEPGTYNLTTGFYTWPNLRRLELSQLVDQDQLILQSIDIGA